MAWADAVLGSCCIRQKYFVSDFFLKGNIGDVRKNVPALAVRPVHALAPICKPCHVSAILSFSKKQVTCNT